MKQPLLNQERFSLARHGHLILTFRNYSLALTGNQRFIPVKSDENRILTCVIDWLDLPGLSHEQVEEWLQEPDPSFNGARGMLEESI